MSGLGGSPHGGTLRRQLTGIADFLPSTGAMTGACAAVCGAAPRPLCVSFLPTLFPTHAAQKWTRALRARARARARARRRSRCSKASCSRRRKFTIFASLVRRRPWARARRRIIFSAPYFCRLLHGFPRLPPAGITDAGVDGKQNQDDYFIWEAADRQTIMCVGLRYQRGCEGTR